MPRAATLRSIADIAEDQWGLFTRRQAEATGMAWTTLARMAKNGVTERVAHGVYRLRGTPSVEHLALRAAWLQLAPDTPVWERTAESGVVCRWSAAAMYGFARGSDAFEFTLPVRRQTRRADVKLYRSVVAETGWVRLSGLLVATPGLIVANLLDDGEDLALVGQLVADALHAAKASERDVAEAIAPHAAAFGFAVDDGVSLLGWLCGMAPARSAPVPPPSSMDSGQREAAAAGQQFLPVQPKVERRTLTGVTTVRVTTVLRQSVRQGVRHDGTRRVDLGFTDGPDIRSTPWKANR